MTDKEVKQLTKTVNQQKHEISRLIMINNKLKLENEQLKQLIKKVLETTPIEHNLALELKNSVRELYD